MVLGADAGAEAVFEQGSSSGQDGGHMLLDMGNVLVRYVCVCVFVFVFVIVLVFVFVFEFVIVFVIMNVSWKEGVVLG